MMPWKLLAFILAMTMVLIFIGFNLENRCNVSLAFHTFTDVPVIITILASFLLGLLMAFPLSIAHKSEKHSNRSKRGYGTERISLLDEQGPSFGANSSAPRKHAHKGAPPEDFFNQD